MNISNSLSILRIVLALPVAYLLFIQENEIAIILGAIAGITDFLDGFLARKLNQVTELGKVIDPIADKLFIGIVGLVLVYTAVMPLWFFASIIIRDVLILLGALYARNKIKIVLTSTFEGKVTYGLILVVTMGMVLNNDYANRYGGYLAVAAMIYTLFQYFTRMLRKIKKGKNKVFI